jgi:hypothetical protein
MICGPSACWYRYSEHPELPRSFAEQCLNEEVPHQRTVDVTNRLELMDALAAVVPGDLIRVADGIYDISSELITITTSGTPADPIHLCGASSAVLLGTNNFPAAITVSANYWNIVGLTIHDFFWGLEIDGGSNNAVREVEIYNTRSYGLRLEHLSADNLIQDCWIHDTGTTDEQYGGAIVVNYDDDTAVGGCDRTQIIGNHFGPNVRGTLVEIQGANVGGLVSKNYFDGTGQVWLPEYGLRAWVVITGSGVTVSKNKGMKSAQHGFAVSNGYLGPPSGYDNVFIDNEADVQSTGYGIWISQYTAGNVVYCNNTVRHADSGDWNVASCQP